MDFFKKTVITRSGVGDQVPYLIRWTLFSCRWFSIKVHRILISDEDCLHDHPWSFLSIILSGGYWEHAPDLEEYLKAAGITRASLYYVSSKYWYRSCRVKRKWYGPGSILWRPHTFSLHRLELEKPATTLMITFKRAKEWGFFTKEGWIPWFKYSPQNKCE